MGIRGNETADETAKGAAAGPAVTRPVLPSLRQVRTLARRAATQHAHKTHRGLEGAKRQAAWYAAATDYQPLDAAEQQPRADGVLLQRLRLGYCTREQLRQDFVSLECHHCGRHSRPPLVHYLLRCPATARLRETAAVGDQQAQQRGLLGQRERQAALLVRHTPRDLLLEVLRGAPPPR